MWSEWLDHHLLIYVNPSDNLNIPGWSFSGGFRMTICWPVPACSVTICWRSIQDVNILKSEKILYRSEYNCIFYRTCRTLLSKTRTIFCKLHQRKPQNTVAEIACLHKTSAHSAGTDWPCLSVRMAVAWMGLDQHVPPKPVARHDSK